MYLHEIHLDLCVYTHTYAVAYVCMYIKIYVQIGICICKESKIGVNPATSIYKNSKRAMGMRKRAERAS